MSTLLNRLAAWKPFTALVIGDFMLDELISGAAERLSPDAPVPVLTARGADDVRSTPGGASNVALCIHGLKGRAVCFGVLGRDSEAETLRNQLREAGCHVDGLLEDSSRPTTVKRSLIGLAQHRHPQKMFRVDFESREPISEALVEQLVRAIEAQLDEADVICLEDYNKGVCTPSLCERVIGMCKKAGKAVLVDPAAIEAYAKYSGATAITPNRTEAEFATGLATPIDATQLHNAGLADRLVDELDLETVVLTLDRHGALLQQRDKEPQMIPTVGRAVYDVTGAGDMVLAALAAARANSIDWPDAVALANAAAGLEVEVFGAQPIAFASIQREVLLRNTTMDGKARSRSALQIELAVHREAGHTIVFTNGCFDVIHAGHVSYLREAKTLGDILVVAVNSDEQVRLQKGDGRPIYREHERLEILSELNCIDYLTVFEEPTVHTLLQELRPDIFVKGGDYQPEEINEYELVREFGLDLRILPLRPGVSTSSVVQRFLDNQSMR